MKLESFYYDVDSGWSVKAFPELDTENTLVLVFFSPDCADSAAIRELLDFYRHSKVVGCSTAGEIHQNAVKDSVITVAVMKLEKSKIKLAKIAINDASESFKAGADISRQLFTPDLKSIMVLSDGLNVNGTELIKGINSIVPNSIAVTGGLAGDGANFKKTYVLSGGEIAPQRIAAIGFYGDHIQISHGSEGGWEMFGPMRTITCSEGNIVYEIDKQPALQLYKQYLGERAAGLPATALLFPLAIWTSPDAKPLVRTILAIDETNQSMTFAGDVPQGACAQLMRANFEKLIEGAANAAQMACPAIHNQQSLAIAISCVGRRLILGERIEEELDACLNHLPANTAQIGFYSYGEISPQSEGGYCDLHNQTMTLTLISEN